MMGGLSGADVGIVVAGGAVVLFAIAYALLRGDRRDPLERLAAWATVSGLDYVPPDNPSELASFVGERDGYRVEVMVERVARGFGNDMPTRLTTVTVGPVGGPKAAASVGAVLFTLQPAAWVLDKDGRAVGESVPSGDEGFDATWSARGVDASAIKRALSPSLRRRLMEVDAEGLVIEIATDSVAIPMPGICADSRELDRRMGLASALARALLDH